MQAEPAFEDPDTAAEVPVTLTMNVGKVNGVGGGLGKASVITLQRLVLVLTSSRGDTLRDTLTSTTTPALSPTSTANQTLGKTYTLKALRTWKIVAQVKDTKDSVVHADSAVTAVMEASGTLIVPLSLTTRYVMYTANFSIPDSIAAAGGSKDQLRINRLVLKVDGVVRADSVRPGFFPANAVSTLSFDYVAPGSRNIELLAYGPLHSWNTALPLYSGSKVINVAAGKDSTISFNLAWVGPTTGVEGITVTLNKVGSATGTNALPGSTGLAPAWSTTNDLTGNGYNDVDFNASATGWVVGENGVILKTTNSGSSWSFEFSNTVENLYSVVAVSNSEAWAVGDAGTIIQGVSGSWVSRAGGSPSSQSLRAFGFKSSTGWAIGTNGTILYTTNLTDASPTWSTQSSSTSQTLNAIAVFGTGSAILVGDNGVIRRWNGTSWSSMTSGTSNDLYGLSCQSSSDCIAVGEGGIILKYNGNSWSSQSSPTSTNLRAVSHQSSTNIMAVGDAGKYIYWNGSNWQNGTSNTTNRLNSVDNYDANNGWAVGASNTIRYRSSTVSTLTAQTLAVGNLIGIFATSASRAIAVGAGGAAFRYSSSSGRWVGLVTGTANQLNSLWFTDDNTGWAVGASGTIIATTNGGNGWTTQSSGTSNALNAVQFVSSSTGWAVGASGTIRKTTNSGGTWSTQSSGTTTALNALYMRSSSLVWVVGASGTIRKTSNGGSNWSAQTSGTTNALNAVFFVDDNTGYAVGAGGTILKTTNGGTNWTAQTSGVTATLNCVYFIDANNGFAVGAGGRILRTTNGGSRWNAQYIGVSPDVFAVTFAPSSPNTGWVAGANGTLMSFNP